MHRFRIVTDFITQHKISYTLGVICMVVASFVQTLFPRVLGSTIDIMKTPNFAGSLVWRNIGFIMLISIVTFGFTYMWRMLVIGNARKLECDMRAKLFNHFLLLSPNFYHKRKVGDLLAYAINDISAVRMSFGPATAMSINSLVICAASIASMVATVDFRLTVLILLPFPIVILTMALVGKKVHSAFLSVQESFADLSGKVNEGILGIRVIKAYVQEYPVLEGFRRTSTENMNSSVKMTSVSSLLGPIIELCFSISFAFALIIGGRMVLDGTITLGAFVAFNTYLAMIIGPVLGIGRIVNLFQRGIASMDRLNEIFHTVPEISDQNLIKTSSGSASGSSGSASGSAGSASGSAGSASGSAGSASGSSGSASGSSGSASGSALSLSQPPLGSFSIRSLSFSYPNSSANVLSIRSLSVASGSFLGIIGATGSGKTTLANLLLRAYEAPGNTVLLDGRSITSFPLEVLRKSIALVSQEPFLFSATLRENISFFLDSYTDDSILKVSEDCCLLETINELPNGLDTVIGERGVNLSGGQKQRVAIARALLRDAPFLILDDALSAVDTLTEAKLLDNILKRRANKTTIVISHRITAIERSDQIIVLESGAIIEQGSHEQLLSKRGRYYDFFKEQEKNR